MEVDSEKKGDNDNSPDGEFSNSTKEQCINYLLSLNDPNEPFYNKGALDQYDTLTLRIWCRKAFLARDFMVRQGLMKQTIAYIPKELKMVRPPTAMEIINAHKEEEKEKKENDGLDKEKEKVNNSKDNGNGEVGAGRGNGRARGRKRALGDIEYGLMPKDQGFELVSAEEAARFRARGFAAVKSEVDKLTGIQFFKKVDGNGQVFYCELNSDGSSRVRPLPQQRPMAYDSDNDINDEGFQNQLENDSFFGQDYNGRPAKRHRPRVAIGQMVRILSYCVYDALVYDALVVLLVSHYIHAYSKRGSLVACMRTRI